MELNIWMSSSIKDTSYDEASNTWTVTVIRPDQTERVLKPKFVVVATGHSGEPNIPTFEGQDKFQGRVCHSSQHTTGGDFTGKKAMVVGCCNSGHE